MALPAALTRFRPRMPRLTMLAAPARVDESERDARHRPGHLAVDPVVVVLQLLSSGRIEHARRQAAAGEIERAPVVHRRARAAVGTVLFDKAAVPGGHVVIRAAAADVFGERAALAAARLTQAVVAVLGLVERVVEAGVGRAAVDVEF